MRILSQKLGPKILSLASMVVLSATGCRQTDSAALDTRNRLQSLAAAYLDYAVAKGTGPASDPVLRRCYFHAAPFKASKCGSDSSDREAAFRSERDGKPFVIRYGVAICQMKGTSAPPIAFERKGRGGNRYVAFANGHVECLNEEAWKKIEPDNQ